MLKHLLRERQPAGSTESDTDRTDHLSEEGTQPELQKADWSKFQNLADVLCRELDTDNSKNIYTNVQQLTDCVLQTVNQAIPRGRGRTTSLARVTTYSASMTNSQKPENDLSSSLRQSTPSFTTRQELLFTKKRSRKLAGHSKKKLTHSTWRKTYRSSGI